MDAPQKSPQLASKQTPSSSAVTRLQRELQEFLAQDLAGSISAFPQDNDLFTWVASLTGSASTVYEDLEFRLLIQFPQDYPFSPPKVFFTTPCFHPNVEPKPNGHICLDILKEQWSAVLSVTSVLLSIQSLLSEPNCFSPLNAEAADLWQKKDLETYKQRVLKYHSSADTSRK